LTTVQACIIHLIRNTFGYVSRRDWEATSKDLRPVYTAPTEQAAAARFDEFADTWGSAYPAVVKLWRPAWAEFIPFLDYDVEVRRIVCSTNAIDSLNARYRRAVRARGHFPNEQAAIKCLHLATRAATIRRHLINVDQGLGRRGCTAGSSERSGRRAIRPK
jgi:transposase-like protein